MKNSLFAIVGLSAFLPFTAQAEVELKATVCSIGSELMLLMTATDAHGLVQLVGHPGMTVIPSSNGLTFVGDNLVVQLGDDTGAVLMDGQAYSGPCNDVTDDLQNLLAYAGTQTTADGLPLLDFGSQERLAAMRAQIDELQARHDAELDEAISGLDSAVRRALRDVVHRSGLPPNIGVPLVQRIFEAEPLETTIADLATDVFEAAAGQ